MVGGGGPHILHLTTRYADAWNADLGTSPETIAQVNAGVDQACKGVGRDPATLERTAFISIDVSGPSLAGDQWLEGLWGGTEFRGTPEELASILRIYAAAGIDRVQVWLNPCTIAGLEAFAPVLELLDAGLDASHSGSRHPERNGGSPGEAGCGGSKVCPR